MGTIFFFPPFFPFSLEALLQEEKIFSSKYTSIVMLPSSLVGQVCSLWWYHKFFIFKEGKRELLQIMYLYFAYTQFSFTIQYLEEFQPLFYQDCTSTALWVQLVPKMSSYRLWSEAFMLLLGESLEATTDFYDFSDVIYFSNMILSSSLLLPDRKFFCTLLLSFLSRHVLLHIFRSFRNLGVYCQTHFDFEFSSVHSKIIFFFS